MAKSKSKKKKNRDQLLASIHNYVDVKGRGLGPHSSYTVGYDDGDPRVYQHIKIHGLNVPPLNRRKAVYAPGAAQGAFPAGNIRGQLGINHRNKVYGKKALKEMLEFGVIIKDLQEKYPKTYRELKY